MGRTLSQDMHLSVTWPALHTRAPPPKKTVLDLNLSPCVKQTHVHTTQSQWNSENSCQGTVAWQAWDVCGFWDVDVKLYVYCVCTKMALGRGNTEEPWLSRYNKTCCILQRAGGIPLNCVAGQLLLRSFVLLQSAETKKSRSTTSIYKLPKSSNQSLEPQQRILGQFVVTLHKHVGNTLI